MKIINRTMAGLILLSAVSIISCKTQVNYISTEKIAPLEAPFEMPQLERPAFSNAVFDIIDFGAKAVKDFNNAGAINKAIKTCTSKGGGHVIIPKGEYYTGPLILQSNVNLHLGNDAVLTFLPDPMLHTEVVLQRYEGTEIMNIQPFIYARDCDNIAITGLGTINGPGEVPWKKNLHIAGNKEGSGILGDITIEEEGGKRWKQNAQLMENYSNVLPVEKRDVSKSYSVLPSLIHLVGCNNVLLEGFKVGECGPKWTIHPTYCKNVIIRRIASAFSGHSSDAIDIDSSTEILVEYCDLSSGDDLVVIKSGTNEDGWRVNKPTKNVIVRHINAFTDTSSDDGIDNAVFSLGTEISGGVNNVYFHDINVVARLFPFRIKSRPGRGGVVQNLTVENLNYGLQGSPHTPWITNEQLKPTGSVCDPLISITNSYRPLRKSYDFEKRTVYKDITFRNIYATKAKVGIYIEPEIANEFQNIVIEDVTIDECKSPLTIHSEAQITLKNYKVAGRNVTEADNEDSYISNKSYRFKKRRKK
jgi:polygalacturonase